MAYSNKKYPRDEFNFPPPPYFLVWAGPWQGEDQSQGTLRHFTELQKAKKHVACYARNSSWRPNPNREFCSSWSIYEWDHEDQKYVEIYSGERGQSKNDNPLFNKRVKPDAPVRKVTDAMLEEVLSSIKSVS